MHLCYGKFTLTSDYKFKQDHLIAHKIMFTNMNMPTV